MIDSENIRTFIKSILAEIVGTQSSDLDADKDFDSYGLSSASAVIMLGELEEFIDMDLSPSILFEHNTINKLSAHMEQLLQLEKAS